MTKMVHTLAPLPYDYAALEPYIDAQTMQLHHDKHHATYVKNLNAALESYANLQSYSPEELVTNLNDLPEEIRTAVRNNGGGHVNHTLFWKSMSPNGGGQPTGKLAQAIKKNFDSFDAFKQQFNDAGSKHFGSGWVWLVLGSDNKLQIITTPNQDSPISQGIRPLLGNDLWEHAYYLKYQNRRPEYLNAWWNVIDWNEIDSRLG
jgi:superoxide dismutase, Fe-Mn family